ncbi:hypothetical protein COU74_01935 [Candidatus Peregrinibacteria bacterium CG10_big_fil_rev_8_21_14_0_10_36_19]|nr:MAG: hypothetical protein COU74_01935 [Candidatus Peregrinibacteria bacterium CG10_big_fil_rev_8_21_14_0_10_36_19]
MDSQDLYEQLKSSLRNGNIIIIESVTIVLLMIILYTTFDFGSLFQGFILLDNNQQTVDVTTVETATTQTPTLTPIQAVQDKLNVSFKSGKSNSELAETNVLDLRNPYAEVRFSVENKADEVPVYMQSLKITTPENEIFYERNLPIKSTSAVLDSQTIKTITSIIPKTGQYTYEIGLYNEGFLPQIIGGNFQVIVESIEPVVVEEPPQAPVAIDIEDTNYNSTNSLITPVIISSGVFPVGFNPQINETKISYNLSQGAKVEVTIVDSAGNNVVTLTDQILPGGTHEVWWNGTNSTSNTGNTVQSGEYAYKIIVRDPSTNAITDTDTGKINAIYSNSNQDFESQTPNSTAPVTTVSPTNNQISTETVEASVALNSATTGKTADTGPSMLIYGAFPLVGYIIRRKK